MSHTATAELATPHAGLLDWLAVADVEHELREHPLTFTARETARVEGIDPRRFAKVVAVTTSDGRKALIVVDAVDLVDLIKARRVLDARQVRLMSEEEMRELAPECAAGTIPPVGDLFGVHVYADHAIREDPEITFHAGSHRFTVHVDRPAWERAARVVYGDLAVERDSNPAWARS
ncbi:MAG TPA: YbaK/EbsC family protein [Candidatus Limnocylindrales bacterium]|nr:YbaK/EbsC family protein [Candidatus Limnocylindrales bacterium]